MTAARLRLWRRRSWLSVSPHTRSSYGIAIIQKAYLSSSEQDRRTPPKPPTTTKPTTTSSVVLLRHGQSTWNKIPTFSGWCDVPLTDLGVEQAVEAAILMKDRGFDFDLCYSSTLKRAYRSAEVALATMGQTETCPLIQSWKLNERHYGALQGLAKASPELHQRYGTEQLTSWRRNMHARPPPMDELHPYYEPPPTPLTESLHDSQQRVLEYWHDTIVPSFRSQQDANPATDNNAGNKTILIVAHANTIRGLVAFLDGIDDDDVAHIHVANSVPLVYQIDPTTGTAVATNESPWSKSKGHWILSADNQERLLDKLGSDSEAFARSVFAAWDVNGDGTLSKEELANGLSTWKRDPNPAINALTGKIFEEFLNVQACVDERITVDKLQALVVAGCKKHNLPFFEEEEVVEMEMSQMG